MRLALVRGFGGVECKQEARGEEDSDPPPPHTPPPLFFLPLWLQRQSGVQEPAPVARVNLWCVFRKHLCANS